MRNRAKCKLCKEIIESFHNHDFVYCKCKEIYVDGGTNCYRAGANDFSNFIRVNDEGLEVEVKVVDKNPFEIAAEGVGKSLKDAEDKAIEEMMKPNKEDLMKMLDEFIKTYEDLPEQAMRLPINHYDHLSLMILFRSILRNT